MFNNPEKMIPASGNTKVFVKLFSENSDIDVWGRPGLTFPSRTNLNGIILS